MRPTTVVAARTVICCATIARTAVEQADLFLRTGSTGRPEKQSIDCLLVTPTNADRFGIFELIRR
jgi:hypothetical protein